MVNVDVSATAFYESGALPQMGVKILNRRSIYDLRGGISERNRVKLEKITKLTAISAKQTFFKIDESEEKQDVASLLEDL
ncbi:unnamed protein product [Umbelopsis vinacea]